MNKLMITGASGFVGRSLVKLLLQNGWSVSCPVRSAHQDLFTGVDTHLIEDINPSTDWRDSLLGCYAVIHLAARVHAIPDKHPDSLAEYRLVNVKSTLNLARQAANLNVRRFIFVSSVKVNGELTVNDMSFRADDIPKPLDPYAISKYEAESELLALSEETGMEVVIIRPPLVYGFGVKANFLSMIKLLDKGIPLPFGNVSNKRSFVFVNNLVDLLERVIDHPKAAGQVFLVSDDHDVSTTTLLRSMSRALGKKEKLIPVPMFVLKTIFYLIGKAGISQRLLGSLRLDISKTKELLNWNPPITFEEGISRTAKSFLSK